MPFWVLEYLFVLVAVSQQNWELCLTSWASNQQSAHPHTLSVALEEATITLVHKAVATTTTLQEQ